MSAIDWEHAPEIAKPTYEELEAMCWELTEQNAELREHVRMPDEPLEIDEKDFYVRAFIKWATEEQPEVKRLEAENEKLRELCRDMWRFTGAACKKYPRLFDPPAQGGQMVQLNAIDAFEQRMRELGIEVDE